MMVPVLVILAFSPTCYGAVFSIEAEHTSIYKGKGMFRAAASGGITVYLVKGGYIEWTLTTSSKCDVAIMDVQYSNNMAFLVQLNCYWMRYPLGASKH